MQVLVTGGSGIVGHYVIGELYKRNHKVINADKVRMGNLAHSGTTSTANASRAVEMRSTWATIPVFYEIDIANYGQVISAMDGCDAVISLASRPSAAHYTEEDVLVTNVSSMWNVCRAAEQLKISRIVLGSSYNAVGAMGTAARWGEKQVKPPEYFPLDDKVYTRSEDPYSIAKWLGEEIGEAFARRNPWMSIASMRFNGMWDDDYFAELAKSPISDPWVRCQGFWTYLHIKDAATACVNSIESESWKGHNRFFLNASDTMITTPTVDAINMVYPDVPIKMNFAKYQAPISIKLAECLLNWRPKFSWRDKKFQA